MHDGLRRILPGLLVFAAQAFGAEPAAKAQLFADLGERGLEPLASGVVLNPAARLRVRVEPPAGATVSVTIANTGATRELAKDVGVAGGAAGMLPESGSFALGGLSGEVTVSVAVTPSGGATQREQWRLVVPAALATRAPAFETERMRGAVALPQGTLGVNAADLAALPSLDLFTTIALRGAQGPEHTRGAAEIALFKRFAAGIVVVGTNDGLGSGVIIDRAERLVVTNWHVVSPHPVVAVVFKPQDDKPAASDSQAFAADVLRVDEVADLALLRVRELPAYVPELKLGAISSVAVGEDVHAIGHPRGERWTYTKGIVSQVRRNYEWPSGKGQPHRATVIQTQTPINPGNSGGPLLDDAGTVVGINSFLSGQSLKLGDAQGDVFVASQGLNFAVSVQDVQAFLAMQTSRHLPDAPKPPANPAARQCTAGRQPIDANKDGRPDGYALDEDCDGKAETIRLDTDGDGRVDTEYVDLDGNGKPDVRVTDENHDGKPDLWLIDQNDDGEADIAGSDSDGDGKPDKFRKIAG